MNLEVILKPNEWITLNQEVVDIIIQNQKLRDEIVDLADIWDGVESIRYGRILLNVLDKLGIKDVPAFYSIENINKMIKELNEERKKK